MVDASESLVGSIVQDRYRIIEFLAEGGMGAVYRAERLGLGRQVAIKFLNPAFAANSQATSRFEREAKAMSRLDHPNCVSVVDFGVASAPYIVMEYVTGDTLRDVLDRGPVVPERAVYFCIGILAGLAHAHEQNIIHRDIKPANVMITEAAGTDGLVRILDFGLAKLRDTRDADLSASWMVVGTPTYMSPEQSKAGQVDARTDLYSTGVLLFELLSGKKPFQSDEAFETLVKHREAPVPRFAELTPHLRIPNELQDVVDRAMAKEADERYASAIDFGNDLKRLLLELKAGTLGKGKGKKKTKKKSDAQPYAKTMPLDAAVLPDLAFDSTQAPLVPSSPRKRGGRRLASLSVVGLLAFATASAFGYGPLANSIPEALRVGKASAPGASQELSAESATEEEAVVASDTRDTISSSPLPNEVVVTTGNSDAGTVEPDAGMVFTLDAGALAVEADLASDAGLTGSIDLETEESVKELDVAAEEQRATEEGESLETAPETAEELAAEEKSVDPPVPEPTLAPAPPKPVRSLADAKRLINQGKVEQAIQGLRQLKQKQPKNAYISVLLGHLYFEKMWWTVALGEYSLAIKKHPSYAGQATLIRNTIRCLGSTKTRWKAQALLVKRIKRRSLPYLRVAARKDKNPLVRKRAAALSKRLKSAGHSKKRRKKSRRRRR